MVSVPSAAQWQRWHVDPAWSRTIPVAGSDGRTRTWHLLERDPGERRLPPVVCLHGNPTWSYLWRGVLERVGEHRRVIAPDQLGMGFSERLEPAAGPRRYVERVADLDDLLRAAEVDGPVVLVGHDWGGAVVMGWAVAHPGRVAGLVLCNTGIAVPSGRRAPGVIRLAAAGPVTDLVGRRTRTFLEGTLALSGGRITAAAREAYRAPYRRAADRAAIAGFVADIPLHPGHPSHAPIATVAEELRRLTAPALLVWGALDPVFDDSFALDLAARLPHAAQHRFGRAGHLAPEEVDVAGVVDAWLRAGPPPSPDAGRPSAGPGRGAWSPVWSALGERAAEDHDEAVAFVDGATGARTSFAELHRRVTGIARGLRELGLQPGERVAVLVPPSVDLVATVYAVWRAGGVTVIADRGLGLRGLGRAVRGARVDWVIGPPRALAAARAMRWAPGAYRVAVAAHPAAGAVATLDDLARSSHALPDEPLPDDPAAVLFTSGATGPAKGVRYRHHQLAAQRDALARTYGITRDDRLVAAFAPFALYGPALGIASTIPDVDVTAPGTLTAEALGAAAASVGATIVFASPAALSNVVRTAGGTPDPRLAGVRLGLSAGAPVPIATLQAMAQLVPGASWHTPYGMTECLPVADIDLAGIDAATSTDAGAGPRGVCVGPPVEGVEVHVPTGPAAEICVRAPWLSDGYDRAWGVEHAARPTGDDGRPWHRTGDVGHLDEEGRLWIEGRSVHVIHTADGPVTPVPVEVAAERLAEVGRCAAVGVGPRGAQQVVLVVERPGGTEGLAPAELAGAVRPAVPVPLAAVLQVRALPVDIRHNTKIDRTLVARWAGQVLGGGPSGGRLPGRRGRPW